MDDKHTKILKTTGMILGALGVGYWLLHSHVNQTTSIPTPTVVVQKPKWEERADYIIQTGNLVAYNSVDLVARVEGYLNSILFTDGSFVKKDQSLLVIQPEPYLEKLKEANASVASAKAAFVYAQSEYKRQQRMYQENATSLNNVEKWQANMAEAEANLVKEQANAVND